MCRWPIEIFFRQCKDKLALDGYQIDAYFHQSHLKGKQDYGHQAVAVMLSYNGIVLNYAFVMYNKSISKIDLVQNIAKELPVPPVMSYFLCDCWYVSEKIINTFAQKGFHTIGVV